MLILNTFVYLLLVNVHNVVIPGYKDTHLAGRSIALAK